MKKDWIIISTIKKSTSIMSSQFLVAALQLGDTKCWKKKRRHDRLWTFKNAIFWLYLSTVEIDINLHRWVKSAVRKSYFEI